MLALLNLGQRETMRDLVRFSGLLRRDLLPLLYGQGFEASGGVFRRVRDERIDIVSLLGSRLGRRCCLNLGVHYYFLPPTGRPPGATTDSRVLREHDCAFRERLREAGESDHWWSYGVDEATAEASAAALVDAYRRRAPLFFARFEPFPAVFDEVTPAQVEAGDFVVTPAYPSRLHAALTMARIMRHLGRPDRCREFAEVGLRDVGCATRTREELEQLGKLG
jgi:hypothetical protein